MKKDLLKHEKNEKLIEKINVLGPWIHGYFDLGNEVIIQDKDELQRKRLFSTRDSLFKILKNCYSDLEIREKTVCDIGCNTGYFLFEIFNKFKVKKAIGIEPRLTNLKKARFIAKYFNLPKNRYQLKKIDILGNSNIPKSDIVIVPGVMHHLDNHLKALEKIYSITNELCIIETMVLPDKINTNEIANLLELKDIIYQKKEFQNHFGIIGLKLESDTKDGSTIHTGIVGIPTTQALVLMMKHVGFEDVEVFLSEKQLNKKIFYKKSYREFNSAIIIGKKRNNKKKEYFDRTIEQLEQKNFNTYVPFEIIKNLFKAVNDKSYNKKLKGISKLIFESQIFYQTEKSKKAEIKLKKIVGQKSYFKIIQTFKHAPYDKICFEYSKTCYHLKKIDESEKVCCNLVKIMNLDWRVVYLTYYLLAKINFDLKNYNIAKKYNVLSLKTNPNFTLSKQLMKNLRDVKTIDN
jgi:SAM-dependent methyltransferase